MSAPQPRVLSANGSPFLVVVRPPPAQTWQDKATSFVGPDGAHYDMARFFTSSSDVYLGIDAQRLTFPDGARFPTLAQMTEGYRVRGAPGFTDSVVLVQSNARLLTPRGAVEATELEARGTFGNGKPGHWRVRFAVVGRMVLQTTTTASEGVLSEWVGVPPGYESPVAAGADIRDPRRVALVTYSFIVSMVETSLVFMTDALAESDAMRQAQAMVAAHAPG